MNSTASTHGGAAHAAPTASPPSLPLAELLTHAAQAVAAVRTGRSLTETLAQTPPRARPGAQALAFHALRHLGTAQAVRLAWVRKPPGALADALLLTALSLLLDASGPRYDAHTVVDQTVRAAKRVAASCSGLINAVLRRTLREPEAVADAVQRDPVAQWNHPCWWIDRLQRDWPEHWAELLRRNNTHPPMTLRVNARHGDALRYVQRLHEAGLAATAVGTHTVVLDVAVPVAQLPGFAQGEVSVQDAAAQWAAPLLLGGGAPGRPALRPGARVLDACAAPGGKTAHLLELADLDLLVLDVDARRATKVSENLHRIGLHADVRVADAARPEAWWDGRLFDAILLDAPCSASGIVRRHPDVRWLRREADIAALARTQDALLDALWPLLAPGGRLLYCTCSVFRDEGQRRSDAFLQRTPDACGQIAPGHVGVLADNSGVQTPSSGAPLPSAATAWLDGFYYALFERHPA